MEENAARNESPNTASGRNRCLDFFKGIAALGVVFVHISFPGAFGKCMSTIGSCGVMLFFMISGYHAYGTREKMCPKLMKRFRRNLLITVIALLIYFAVEACSHISQPHDLERWLRNFTKPKLYLDMFIFNELEIINADPLWFMIALLYAYLIFWLMYRLKLERFAKYAMPLFILLRIGLETYKYYTDGDWRICSNVFVAALPLMLLGYCIAEKKEKLLRIPAAAAAISGIVMLILLFILVIKDPFRYNISQIFKLAVVVSALLFSLKKPALRIFPPLCALGGKYSLHVYLWHMPVIVLLYPLCVKLGVSERFYEWYLPVIVAAVSIVLAVIIVSVISLLTHRPRTADNKT
ncbi:MAG: acyltransferase [Ruminococcus sp.]|nr:acyltransferase [Ruminococcus sp.]